MFSLPPHSLSSPYYQMELVAENGCSASIVKGCKKELGRGSELEIHDKTVSRRQISLELQEQSKEARSGGNSTYFGLCVKVLGANPVCIVHIGQSTGSSNNDQAMTLLRKGDIKTLFPGDRISLSLSLPMFLTVRECVGRKNMSGAKNSERVGGSSVLPIKEEEMATNDECSNQVAEEDLVGSWKNRKNKKKSEPCITDDTEHTEALEKRQVLADEGKDTNEEEAGIAQAVARRQKRALERRQQQEQNRNKEGTGLMEEVEDVPNSESEASKLEKFSVDTENIDPVKEFGFLVEGLEFDQYKKRHKLDGGRWVWPPAEKSLADSGSDEDDQDQHERHRQSRKGKKRIDEDEEEWKGDDQDEKVAVASAKKRKEGAKVNLRSHEPSSSKKRDTAVRKAVSGSKSKLQEEEIEDEDEEEEEDEADESLGGFIVNDKEEDDPIDDNSDDEEDEDSDDGDFDEEMDEAEEENEEDAKQNKRKKKKEKPLCKYGKKCYRKNRDHLLEFRH